MTDERMIGVESVLKDRLRAIPDQESLSVPVDENSNKYQKVAVGIFSGTRVPISQDTGGIAGVSSPYGDITPGKVVTKNGESGTVTFQVAGRRLSSPALDALKHKKKLQDADEENESTSDDIEDVLGSISLETPVNKPASMSKKKEALSAKLQIVLKTKFGTFRGKVVFAENTLDGFVVLVYIIGDNIFIPPVSADPIKLNIATGEEYTVLYEGVNFELNATELGYIVFRLYEEPEVIETEEENIADDKQLSESE